MPYIAPESTQQNETREKLYISTDMSTHMKYMHFVLATHTYTITNTERQTGKNTQLIIKHFNREIGLYEWNALKLIQYVYCCCCSTVLLRFVLPSRQTKIYKFPFSSNAALNWTTLKLNCARGKRFPFGASSIRCFG